MVEKIPAKDDFSLIFAKLLIPIHQKIDVSGHALIKFLTKKNSLKKRCRIRISLASSSNIAASSNIKGQFEYHSRGRSDCRCRPVRISLTVKQNITDDGLNFLAVLGNLGQPGGCS